jgi:Flp pilus assembly pilin Flp
MLDFRCKPLKIDSEVSEKFQRSKAVKIFEGFLHDERGAELAEYAVGTAILVAIAIIVYQVLGSAVNIKMNRVANEIQK